MPANKLLYYIYRKRKDVSLNKVKEAITKTSSLNNPSTQNTALVNKVLNPNRQVMLSFIKSLDQANDLEESSNEFQSKTLAQFLNTPDTKSLLLSPFLLFFAPTDEFVLTLSFVLFFIMCYYFLSPLIVNLMITPQIQELTTNFTKAVSLRKQTVLLTQLKAKNKKLKHTNALRVLLLYNTLYTSLALAAKHHFKHIELNELLSSYKSQASKLEPSIDHLFSLFSHHIESDIQFDVNQFNQIRLISFVCEHINQLEDPFSLLEEILPDEDTN
jgi:hypothetical protein